MISLNCSLQQSDLKMKFFQVVQANFALLGISSNQSRCNEKSAITCLIFGLAITFGILYLFFKANTFLEYTMSIFVTSTLCGLWFDFLSMLIQKQRLFELISESEEFVEKSQYLQVKNRFFSTFFWAMI